MAANYSSSDEDRKREWKKGPAEDQKVKDFSKLITLFIKLSSANDNINRCCLVEMREGNIHFTNTRIPPFPDDNNVRSMRREVGKGSNRKKVQSNGFNLTIERYSQKVAKLFKDHSHFLPENVLSVQDENLFQIHVRSALQAGFSVMYSAKDLTLPDFRSLPESINYLNDEGFLKAYDQITDLYGDTGKRAVSKAVAKRKERENDRNPGNSQETKSPEKPKRYREEEPVEDDLPLKRARTTEENEIETIKKITDQFLNRLLQENGTKVNTQVLLEQSRAKVEELKKENMKLLKDEKETIRKLHKSEDEYALLHKTWKSDEEKKIKAENELKETQLQLEETEERLLVKIRKIEDDFMIINQKAKDLERSVNNEKKKKKKFLRAMKKNSNRQEYNKMKKMSIFNSSNETSSSSSDNSGDEEVTEPCPVPPIEDNGRRGATDQEEKQPPAAEEHPENN